jgi:hypothetical protein
MTGIDNYFFESLWPGLAFWAVLYISDYYLTLTCARLYQRGVREKIEFEGSYEITPYFQADIDSLRAISPRFIAALLWTEVWLAATWWFSWQSTIALYQMVFGAMVSVELAVHIRHFRNLFLFRAISGSDAAKGRIQYSRTLSLRMSATELYGFAALFLVISVFTQNWFTVGGTMSCFVTATKHLRLAQKAASAKLPEARSAAVAGT